jgi:hypothetical protein
MKTYKCKYGLYHDKPVSDGEPSSDNGWIYTAYAKSLGLQVPSWEELSVLMKGCMEERNPDFWIERLPVNRRKDELDPPVSHDELIGMISLSVLPPLLLKNKGWTTTTVSSEDYTWLEQLEALWLLRGQHRTFIHKEEIREAYPIAFKLGAHIRYYAKKLHGKKTTMFEALAFHVSIVLDIFQSSAWASTHNISTLMLEDLNSKFLIKFFNKEKNYLDYFQEGHPFVTNSKDLR